MLGQWSRFVCKAISIELAKRSIMEAVEEGRRGMMTFFWDFLGALVSGYAKSTEAHPFENSAFRFQGGNAFMWASL